MTERTTVLSAIEKRAANPTALAPFAPDTLRAQAPLTFPRDPDLPPSPKRRYQSAYQYPGPAGLTEEILDTGSVWEICCYLIDYSGLEPLLAAHVYAPSAKGQTPFHPISMYLLSLYRHAQHLSRPAVLRLLRHPKDGQTLRADTGFSDTFPGESGLRDFEKRLTPELQQEINACLIDLLYHAGLLPVKPGVDTAVPLSFDGMLHDARSRRRCSSVRAACYQAAPRTCPAHAKGKRGCDCATEACADHCRHATPRDPEARLVVYSGDNQQRADSSPNTALKAQDQRSRVKRLVYGYYSYAGQLLDPTLATYWILPAAFGTATAKDAQLFPDNFAYLQARFPWLQISEVLADAAACEQTCLDAIWDAGALRMVDLRADKHDADPETCLARGYNAEGYPLCPHGYALLSNGYDYDRRRAKWRCSHHCRHAPERPMPACPFLADTYKHGYTTTVGRTHADGSVRLARELPYNSPAWKQHYGQRNCAESRNSVLQRLGLKRLPLHGYDSCHVTIMQGDFIANLCTLVRLMREATALQ
jgi:hypothetical protein